MTEREQVIANLLYMKRDCLEGSDTDNTIDRAIALLKEPDWVKVVRCGDCRCWEPPTKEEAEDGCTYGRCRDTGAGADLNDFCSNGERQ